MKRFLADLHIHTALSPCGDAEMTPPAIVRTAIERGLAMIAICDHNTTGNAAAVAEAARQAGGELAVIAGMEIATAEEVHVVALFGDDASAGAADAEVRQSLPSQNERSARLGPQWKLDAAGRQVGQESRMLAAATPFSLEQTVELIHRHGGLAVAAHVDRPSFSVTSQLGVLPAGAGFDAIELSRHAVGQPSSARFANWGVAMVASSDSHYLADIGAARTELLGESASFAELRLALARRDGREVAVA